MDVNTMTKQELESLGFQQYNQLNAIQAQVQQIQKNIILINARLAELRKEEKPPKEEEKKNGK